MNVLDLVIVIISWNVRELLEACLVSVYKSLEGSNLRSEVWVVDNSSSDGSAEMVRERFPQAKLIANETNIGFAAANNQALRALGFATPRPPLAPRHVLLLNPDTVVVGDALATMVRFLDENPSAGVAGAKLLHPDGRLQHSAFAFPTLAQAFLDFFPIHHRLLESRLNGRYPRRFYKRGEPFSIDHPLGAAMMIRGEAIEQAGLLDEGFRIYCEEIDWCMRMKKAGWGVYCVPGAEVVHYVAGSTRQVRDEMFVELWRSRYRLFEKHYGRSYRWAVRHIVRLGLRAKMRQARAAHERGEMSEAELKGKLAAYQQVMRMFSTAP
ncbi:MAG: glycosyltransferase family 2 protein [Chloroflexota bacterium]|nr:glycosyltransferase family 2 protein [Chloroflexota bacterium]